jgi:hypothetical protein
MWTQIGGEDNVTLPRINGKEDWEGQVTQFTRITGTKVQVLTQLWGAPVARAVEQHA